MFLIQFFIAAKLTTSTSFRALERFSPLCNQYFGMNLGQPSYGTILLWTKKIGLYNLNPVNFEKADDWVLIVDESIAIGHERLLVIYGVRASQIDFNRALTYSDITPLFIKASSVWNAECIEKVIEKLKESIGNIKYIVSDGGQSICKSIKLTSHQHVYDITHKLAWFLKIMYKNNETFISYTKEMAQMRFKGVRSEMAHIIPPSQRIDSRFMNLDILSDWGIKALKCLEKAGKDDKIYKWLSWVKKYEEFIGELVIVNNIITEIKSNLKTKGLSVDTIKEVRKIFRKNEYLQYKSVKQLKNSVIPFYQETLDKLPDEPKLLCSSDIIESSFGKYKSYLSKNPMGGFTDLSLLLSTITSGIDPCLIKESLENTKIGDLKLWSKENIGESNFARRKRILSNNRV